MEKTICATDIRNRFSEHAKALKTNNEIYIITKRGKNALVLLDYEMYIKLKERKQSAWAWLFGK